MSAGKRRESEQMATPEARTALGLYLQGARRKIEALDKTLKAMEARIARAQDDIREHFAELKKIEITQKAARETRDAAKVKKKEEAELDDIALGQLQPARREGIVFETLSTPSSFSVISACSAFQNFNLENCSIETPSASVRRAIVFNRTSPAGPATQIGSASSANSSSNCRQWPQGAQIVLSSSCPPIDDQRGDLRHGLRSPPAAQWRPARRGLSD